IYWASIEGLKSQIQRQFPNRTYLQDLAGAFAAGSVSGIIAAIFTHPFDVVKTVNQVSSEEQLKKSAWMEVYRQNGFRGFWLGLAPRLAKAAPACGLMISTYEIGKRFLGDQD
ncbi:hypothetical protein HDU91_004205, partial [Kappamyces sp. JEL0680]